MATQKLSVALLALTTPEFGYQLKVPSLKLNGTVVAATAAEINYLSGVTSAIQTQIDAKLAGASYTAADVLTKLNSLATIAFTKTLTVASASSYDGGQYCATFNHDVLLATGVWVAYGSTGTTFKAYAGWSSTGQYMDYGIEYHGGDSYYNFHGKNASNADSVCARFYPRGAVELYHANSKKFETTSMGVDIAGAVIASGGAIFNTDAVVIDEINKRIGVGKATPLEAVDINGSILATGGAIFNTNAVVIDSVNKRIGVGKATPLEAVDVNGNILATGDIIAYA